MAIPIDNIATTTRLQWRGPQAIVFFVPSVVVRAKEASDDWWCEDCEYSGEGPGPGFDQTDQPFGPGQRWIELMIPGSDTNLGLFTPDGHENRIGGFQSMTFWTDDVFATAEQMKKNGVDLTDGPRKEIWGTMAKFRDPDGNEFVFSSR